MLATNTNCCNEILIVPYHHLTCICFSRLTLISYSKRMLNNTNYRLSQARSFCVEDSTRGGRKHLKCNGSLQAK
jgi:hypothetical protein